MLLAARYCELTSTWRLPTSIDAKCRDHWRSFHLYLCWWLYIGVYDTICCELYPPYPSSFPWCVSHQPSSMASTKPSTFPQAKKSRFRPKCLLRLYTEWGVAMINARDLPCHPNLHIAALSSSRPDRAALEEPQSSWWDAHLWSTPTTCQTT